MFLFLFVMGTDLGQIRNCFGLKYYCALLGLVYGNYDIRKCKPRLLGLSVGSIAPGKIN